MMAEEVGAREGFEIRKCGSCFEECHGGFLLVSRVAIVLVGHDIGNPHSDDAHSGSGTARPKICCSVRLEALEL